MITLRRSIGRSLRWSMGRSIVFDSSVDASAWVRRSMAWSMRVACCSMRYRIRRWIGRWISCSIGRPSCSLMHAPVDGRFNGKNWKQRDVVGNEDVG